MRRAIEPFCALDKMAVGLPGNRYTIDSLYFDTRDLQLFYANDLEMPRRFKARIRGYPLAPGSPVFFEIKGRDGDIVLKTRGRVERDAWQALVAKPPLSLKGQVRDTDLSAVERFLSLKMRHGLEPVCIVRYDREPWVSTINNYARVTFDTRIRNQRMSRLSLDGDKRGWRANDNPVLSKTPGNLSPTVLELKFERGAPNWLVNIVERLGLTRLAFSKYGTAVKGIYTPHEPRTVRSLRARGRLR